MYGVAPRSLRPAPTAPVRQLAAAAALLVAALAAPAGAQAPPFVVDSPVDAVDAKPGDGACASAAGQCTLRAAVMEANARAGPDRIRLPKGRFDLSLPGAQEDASRTGDLDVLDDLVIEGSGTSATVIAAGGLDRVLHAPNADGLSLTLDSLTVTEGVTTAEGDSGGGIAAGVGTSLVLRSVAVLGNASFEGGGIYSAGALALYDTTVSDNRSNQNAGGIHLDSGWLVVAHSSVVRNRAGGAGGGIYAGLNGSASSLVNVTIGDNTAAEGGGLMLFDHTEPGLLINNATVARNRVLGGKGGGVWFAGLAPSILNSIVADNDLSGAGLDCATPLATGGYNLDGDESCGFDMPGDLPGLDPMLLDLADNGGPTPTYALRPGSPAVDRGSPQRPGIGLDACDVFDQRHTARGRCDIGAFELGVCGDGAVDPGSGEQCEPGESIDGCCTTSCVWKPVGGACSDGDLCTQGDACDAAHVCAGSPVVCPDDGEPCNGGESCDPGTGGCVSAAPPPAGSACSDGDVCTLGDQCRDAVCVPGLDSRVDSDGDGHFVIGACVAPADDCDDGDGQIHGGASERCDGKDNDCNELDDDGIADIVTGTDTGQCRVGIQRCRGGRFQEIQAEIGPSAEVCDALDNDCNGSDDDGIADRAVGTDVGECRSGLQSCQDGGWDTVVRPVGPGDELCDRLDNDCDGQPDDGLGCFDDWSEDIEISGGLAYVAAGGAGLRVLQIVDVSGFQEVWFYAPSSCLDSGRAVPFYADDVEIAGGYAFVSAGPCGLVVVDVDLGAPGFVAALDTPGWTEDVVVEDAERGVAYLADHNGGLLEVDVGGVLRGQGAADPPRVLRSLGVGDGDFGAAIDLALRGRLVYAATTTGLHIVYAGAEVEQMQEMGAWRTDGGATSGLVPQDVELHPNPLVDVAYVAGWIGGLLVLDVSDPTAPVPTLEGPIPTGWASYEASAVGSVLFLADGIDDVRFFDISDPAVPVELSGSPYAASGVAWDVAAWAGTVYIAYGVQGDPASGGIEAVGPAALGLPAGALEPVPEPGAGLLCAVAVACLAALRRWRGSRPRAIGTP